MYKFWSTVLHLNFASQSLEKMVAVITKAWKNRVCHRVRRRKSVHIHSDRAEIYHQHHFFIYDNLESGDCNSAPSKYSRHILLHCNFVHVTKGMHAPGLWPVPAERLWKWAQPNSSELALELICACCRNGLAHLIKVLRTRRSNQMRRNTASLNNRPPHIYDGMLTGSGRDALATGKDTPLQK